MLARAQAESKIEDLTRRLLGPLKLPPPTPEPPVDADGRWSAVAERQRQTQEDLIEAQKIYTQMAQDRYRWINTMKEKWQQQ